jgi:hypothetical protein
MSLTRLIFSSEESIDSYAGQEELVRVMRKIPASQEISKRRMMKYRSDSQSIKDPFDKDLRVEPKAVTSRKSWYGIFTKKD